MAAVGLGSVRPETPFDEQARRARNRTVLEVIALVGAFVFIGFVLWSAQFSSSTRWGLGILFLVVLIAVVTYVVLRRTRNPEPLSSDAKKDRTSAGELSVLTGVAARANRGMVFSEDRLVTRVRDAVMDRVRLTRGLSSEEALVLPQSGPALEAVVRDRELSQFLLATNNRDARVAWAEATRKGSGLFPTLQQIVDRVEAWR